MRRTFSLSGLSIFVAAIAFVGCGGSDDTSKDSVTVPAATETIVADTSDADETAAGDGHTAEATAAAKSAADHALEPFASDAAIPQDMLECLHENLTDSALEMGPDTFIERYDAGESDSEFIVHLGQIAGTCGFT